MEIPAALEDGTPLEDAHKNTCEFLDIYYHYLKEKEPHAIKTIAAIDELMLVIIKEDIHDLFAEELKLE